MPQRHPQPQFVAPKPGPIWIYYTPEAEGVHEHDSVKTWADEFAKRLRLTGFEPRDEFEITGRPRSATEKDQERDNAGADHLVVFTPDFDRPKQPLPHHLWLLVDSKKRCRTEGPMLWVAPLDKMSFSYVLGSDPVWHPLTGTGGDGRRFMRIREEANKARGEKPWADEMSDAAEIMRHHRDCRVAITPFCPCHEAPAAEPAPAGPAAMGVSWFRALLGRFAH